MSFATVCDNESEMVGLCEWDGVGVRLDVMDSIGDGDAVTEGEFVCFDEDAVTSSVDESLSDGVDVTLVVIDACCVRLCERDGSSESVSEGVADVLGVFLLREGVAE